MRLGMDSSRFSKGISKAKSSLGGLTSYAKRAVLGLGAVAAAALVPAIKVASDLEETMNKFNVVFGESSSEVKAWGDGFAGTVGRSKLQIADFLASSQDLFVPLGFEPGAAEKMSKNITALAVDLASFNNMQDTDTLRDLQAALTGSGEVMKKYGVIVSEAAVKQQALSMGFDPKNLTEQQKVMARMQIIMEGTTAAQGDATRSAGSFANQMKALKATFSDTAAEIGGVFLPVATSALKGLIAGIKFVVFSVKNIGLVWGVMAESAGNALTYAIARAKWFGGAVMDVLGFVGRNWRELFIDLGTLTLIVFKNLGDNIMAIMKAAWDWVASGFTGGFQPMLKGLTEGFQSSLKEGLEIRGFEPPKVNTAAAKAFGDAYAKEMDLGQAMADAANVPELGFETGEGSLEGDDKPNAKAHRPQGPTDAISVNSKEGFAKILMAMQGKKGGPEDKTAKNTEKMTEQLGDIINIWTSSPQDKIVSAPT